MSRYEPQIHSSFLVDIAMGKVPGYSYINKFGHNPAVATGGEDIWAGGGAYGFYPTTAQAMEIVSSEAADDGDPAGTGARTVKVYGLDANWEEIDETVTLNGTTAVNLTNSYIRVYRAEVLTAGTAETNVGNISIRIQTGGTVGAYISAGDGQTQQAIFTIPAGKCGFFIKGYVGIADSGKEAETAGFQWKIRPNNGTTGAWQTKGQISLVTLGSSHWQYEYGIPAGPIPPKSDIKIECFETSTEMGVVAGMDILMVTV